MNKSTAPKLAPAMLRALKSADAALAKSSATVQVAFQAFVAVVVKAYPSGVKAADLLRAIHGADAASKADGKPTAEYTRAARAVRAAFPATVKTRAANAGKAGKAGKSAGKGVQKNRVPTLADFLNAGTAEEVAAAIAGAVLETRCRAIAVALAKLTGTADAKPTRKPRK